MKSILPGLFSYFLINFSLIALGVVNGLVLHWTVRAVSLETGILTGVVATGFSIHYFGRFLNLDKALNRMPDQGDDAPRRVDPYPFPFEPDPAWPRRKRKRS